MRHLVLLSQYLLSNGKNPETCPINDVDQRVSKMVKETGRNEINEIIKIGGEFENQMKGT